MVGKILFIFFAISIVSVNCSNCADSASYAVQEPKGDTVNLVDFIPQKINFPFEIKYPAKWYVREELTGNMPALILSQEPIKNDTDKYKVGVSLLYNVGYFSSRESSSSALGQTADLVVRIRDWKESKKQFVEGLKEAGNTIISQSDIKVSGQPALRVEFESKAVRVTVIYVQVGVHLLMMTFESPPQEYNLYKDIFEKMINSLFFTR
ncbi:MAG: hypothetical protein NTY76_07135 [Candidatus Omnitrophica bacterium]|nr:hypothetical protein [Candidatus Omnitrophota bacterium]